MSWWVAFACFWVLMPTAEAFERSSFRLRGMGTGLSWLVDDPFTDLFNNPATLVEQQGLSLYTNLSNIDDHGSTNFLSATEDTRVDLTGNMLLGGTWVNVDQSFGFGVFVEYGDLSLQSELSVPGSGTTSTQGVGLTTVLETDAIQYDHLDVAMTDTAILVPVSVRVSETISLGITAMFEAFTGDVALGQTSSSVDSVSANGQAPVSFTRTEDITQGARFENNWSAGGVLGLRYSTLDETIVAEVVAGFAPTRIPLGLTELDALLGGTGLGDTVDTATPFADPDDFDIHADAIQLHLRGAYRFTPEFSISAALGFELLKLNPRVERETLETLNTFEGDVGTGYDQSTRSVRSSELDASISHIPLRVGAVWSLEDWGTFALGVNTHLFLMELHYTEHPNVSTTSYDHSNPPFDHPFVSEVFTTDNVSRVLNGSWTLLTLSVPVGLEVRATDWLDLRLGAESFLPLVTSGSTEGEVVDESDYTRITYLDPIQGGSAVIETDGTASVVKSPESVQIEADDQRTTLYSAGLGFRLNNNLRMDALSFADLTNLSFWKLSVVFDYQF
jgi:hypothetical protein